MSTHPFLNFACPLSTARIPLAPLFSQRHYTRWKTRTTATYGKEGITVDAAAPSLIAVLIRMLPLLASGSATRAILLLSGCARPTDSTELYGLLSVNLFLGQF